jgi:ParB-like chromosome segregation protein Spo0J
LLIEKIPVAKLNPATYNPRKDLKPGDKEYEKLKRSITEFGYVEPVIWNKQTGNVVGGHQRLKVLSDLGQTEVDCVIVELDEAREKALNLALNKIQGDWDETKLAAIMAEFDATSFDVSITGFDADEVDALLNKFYSKEAIQDDFDVDKEIDAIKPQGKHERSPETFGYWEIIACFVAIAPASRTFPV